MASTLLALGGLACGRLKTCVSSWIKLSVLLLCVLKGIPYFLGVKSSPYSSQNHNKHHHHNH